MLETCLFLNLPEHRVLKTHSPQNNCSHILKFYACVFWCFPREIPCREYIEEELEELFLAVSESGSPRFLTFIVLWAASQGVVIAGLDLGHLAFNS